MNLIISFSGRKAGNCDQIAQYLQSENDKIIYLREMNIHPCMNCEYECFQSECKYRDDDIYAIYDSMCCYDKVIFIIPMYCGNPSSLYFIFNERCQDYFMHNDCYEEIMEKLYMIGIYGSKQETPDFVSMLEKEFDCRAKQKHVLGIERHRYNQKMHDSILEIEDVKKKIHQFLDI